MQINFVNRTRRLSRAGLSCALALLLFALPTALVAQATSSVGFSLIQIPDPVNGGKMPGVVFYPASARANTVTKMGPYDIDGTLGAPALLGARPLVVISHGNGGSMYGHHDLATYLASHGFVVAAVEHPRDNFHDQSGALEAQVMVGRPIQISSAITMLLGDPKWKNLIDPTRIGVAGFSSGGYTSLLLVGAVPKFDRFISYCNEHPDDTSVCSNRPLIEAAAARQGKTIEQSMAELQKSLTRWGNTADPRVKAAFVMSPLSLVFDQAGIASIDRPVFLYYGADDHVLRPSENAARIRPMIRTLVGARVVPQADHWVFLSPCSAALAATNKAICSDPPGVDRVKVHAQLNADAVAFFQKSLAVAAH